MQNSAPQQGVLLFFLDDLSENLPKNSQITCTLFVKERRSYFWETDDTFTKHKQQAIFFLCSSRLDFATSTITRLRTAGYPECPLKYAKVSIYTKNDWKKKKKKRLCVRLRSGDKRHLRKSADRRAQIRPLSGTNAFLICAHLRIFSGGVYPPSATVRTISCFHFQ